MNRTRDNILERLRQGQGNQAVAASREDLPPLSTLPVQQWKTRFIELMEANHGDVRELPEFGLAEVLTSVLKEYQASKLMLADRPESEGLVAALDALSEGIQLVIQDRPLDNDPEGDARQQLFEWADAGLCWASAALAETGSLVLETGPDQPRTLSLVPPLSIVVVRQSTLISGLTALFSQQRWLSMPSNLLLVSGPSKTADIQQTLAYGAHGPRSLVVLWINDEVEQA